jgi:uncharacterized protein
MEVGLTTMKIKLWNSLLIATGTVGVLSPDLTRLGPWLASLGLGWATHPIHILGGAALATATWGTFQERLIASKAWNRIALGAGIASIMSPDLTGLTAWLIGLHVGWLAHVAHGIGGFLLLAANWDRIAGRLAMPARPPTTPSATKPTIPLDEIARFCQQFQVSKLSLFGSILRDDFDEASDVDVLIDIRERHLSFREECKMIDSLETMFKHKVDLLTTSALESPSMNPHLKDSISSTARLVHDVSGLAKNPSP